MPTRRQGSTRKVWGNELSDAEAQAIQSRLEEAIKLTQDEIQSFLANPPTPKGETSVVVISV
jgi:hypothetical protein